MTSAPRPRRRMVAAGLALVVMAGTAIVVGPAGADQLSDKRAEAASVAARLAALDGSLREADAQFEEANYRLHQAEQAVAAAERLAAQTKAEMGQREKELSSFAVKAYKGGAEGTTVDALLGDDATSGAIAQSYMTSLSGSRQDIIDALNAARTKAQEDAARLATARAEASTISEQIASVRAQAKAARDEQAALNARVQGELSTLVRQEQERIRQAQAAAAAAARQAAASRAPINVNVPPANGTVANTAIRAGMTKLGATYVWAAAGPSVFDCSGFTQWAFAQAGVSLPHFSGAQYAMTTRISPSQLQPGDLVFWGGGGSAHVAIYIGNDQILHAFGQGVGVTNLDGWWKSPTAYGRLNL